MIDNAPPPPTDEGRSRPERPLFAKVPGWVLAAAAVVLGLAIVWLLSYPGGNLTIAVLSGIGLLAVLAVWLVRTVTWARARADGRASGSPAMVAIVPAVVVVVALLMVTSAPAKVRFSLAKDDFEAVVADAPAPTDVKIATEFDVPDRIGSYDVSKAYRQGDAVIFEVPGGFFSTVGFAYLPSGPFDELDQIDLEGVEFTKLTGDWYTFKT